ncbi:MAG: alpha/beta hydrolase [Acholeplasmataceae bacterium]|nr:alpha/beta hydrolase [Acholeplasmataceae bacterium]
MSILHYKGRNIFYEVNGEGKPILILNGIMMSTKSWEPFVNSFTANNQLIRVDFIDQGQSDKLENSAYTLDLQVDILATLLKHLDIHQVNLVGISYGGEVATMFAIDHPSMVERLVLFNTTPYTSPWLAEIGHQWNAIGKTRDGFTYYKATIPAIYSPSYFESRLDWMKNREKLLIPIFSNPVFLDAMERLTNSAESYDVRENLDKITVPTLIIAADEDSLTPIANQRELHKYIKNSELVILPGVGHASMYERPLLFMTLVLGFINTLDTVYKV